MQEKIKRNDLLLAQQIITFYTLEMLMRNPSLVN